MDYYFGVTSQKSLTFFGPLHLSLLFGTIFIIYLIYKNKEYLKTIKYLDKIIVAILFLNILFYSLGGTLLGEFDLNFHIPIQYCYITGFIYMYMMLTKKEKLYNFLYYAIIFCTSTVLIFQDPAVAYDRYHFILLIISHHFLLISSFYTFYVLEYKVDKSGILKFIIYSISLYAVVYIINIFLNTSYIFKDSFPEFMYTYFPFMDKLNPFIWFVLFSFPMMGLSYYLVKSRDKKITK